MSRMLSAPSRRTRASAARRSFALTDENHFSGPFPCRFMSAMKYR